MNQQIQGQFQGQVPGGAEGIRSASASGFRFRFREARPGDSHGSGIYGLSR